MKTLLVTGVTGMLGHFVLRDWLQSGQQIAVVVRDKRHLAARERIEQIMTRLERQTGSWLPRPIVFNGEIRQPQFGLKPEDARWVAENCDSILHVAASVKFYADDVPDKMQTEPWLSNVGGMQQVLDSCRELGIENFHHVSTAFVSGVTDKTVTETVLENPRFDNDYTASKALAESLVRKDPHLKSKTFMRPSIIIGDSDTGYTSGFHGIYTALQLGHLFLIGVVREGETLTPESIESVIRTNFIGQLGLVGDERKNMVPADWVSQAILEIVQNPELHNQTYHLSNPTPVTLPLITTSMRDAALSFLPELKDSSKGIPNELLELEGFKSLMATYRAYFNNDPDFESSNTQSVTSIPPCPQLDHDTLVSMWKFAIEVDFSPPRPVLGAKSPDLERYLECAINTSASDRRLRATTNVVVQVDGPGGGRWTIGFSERDGDFVPVSWVRGDISLTKNGGHEQIAGKVRLNAACWDLILDGGLDIEDAFFNGLLVATAADADADQVNEKLESADEQTDSDRHVTGIHKSGIQKISHSHQKKMRTLNADLQTLTESLFVSLKFAESADSAFQSSGAVHGAPSTIFAKDNGK